jgi:hypothetical protein
VSDERVLVASGIHSRRRAADALGVEDPEGEFSRWLEEEASVSGTAQHTRTAPPNGVIGRRE